MLPPQLTTIFAPPPGAERHLVVGSGGSRTLLGGAGCLLAFELAGIDSWSTAGGISGGAIVSLLIAAGYKAQYIVKALVELDFHSLLTRRVHPLGVFAALLLKDYYSWRRPSGGAMLTDRLGEHLESLVSTWPTNFWTLATIDDGYLLFCSRGVFYVSRHGETNEVSDQTPPVGLAIRATCTVPGLMSPVSYAGYRLYDGVLGKMGPCPVQVPLRAGVEPSLVVALDSGEEPNLASRTAKVFWGTIFGGLPWLREFFSPENYDDAVQVVSPRLSRLPSLRFHLSPEEKWRAIMAGFLAATESLTGTSPRADKIGQLLEVSELYLELCDQGHGPNFAGHVQEMLVSNGVLSF